MRYFRLLLVLSLCLLGARRACALDFFGDALYWQATETVDWVLNTNRQPSDQFVTYKSTLFNFGPGFRVGVGQQEEDWGTKVYYTHFFTSTTDSASGNLTAAFLGGKEAQPPSPTLYFSTGQLYAAINYNIFDWDVGKNYHPAEALTVRPVLGLRGGWINQAINTGFQAQYSVLGTPVAENAAEQMKNNFWGVGPKVGLENSLNLWRGEQSEINCVANFYTAYLLGRWSVSDVTANSTNTTGVDPRNFGALAFQAILGLNLKYGNWSATVGYEFNDWLNQLQIFDDATGPHNNDLILQGLTLRAGYSY
jgi:hypothetical protein